MSISEAARPTELTLTPVGESASCCTSLSREPMSAEQATNLATQLKALADPVRLQLLSMMAAGAEGESCVCDLNEAFELSQPTISHHLKVLHQAGLLERSKRGVWVYYRVRSEAVRSLGELIASAGA